MPWMCPDGVDSYVRLLEAMDRDRFGVRHNPTNMINCPERYHNNADLVTGFVSRLGPHIRSTQAKDVIVANTCDK